MGAVKSHLLDHETRTDRRQGFKRLQNFLNFSMNYPGWSKFSSSTESYYFIDNISIRGVKLGVTGLNSAWMSTKKEPKKGKSTKPDPDLENLILGEPQIRESAKLVSDSLIRIALIHHPPVSDWFRNFDKHYQRRNLNKFDFVLRGHEGEQFQESHLNYEKGWIEISAGNLYESSNEKPNRFNVVRLDLNQRCGWIFMFKYDDDYDKWCIDVGPKLWGYEDISIHDAVWQRFE